MGYFLGVWGYKFFEDGSYEYQGVFAQGSYGSVIDIERQTPMFANYLVIEVYPSTIRPPFLFGVRELGLYSPQSPLKITSPTTGAQFIVGETVDFVGSYSGEVTNIQWLDNGLLFGSGLTASKSGFTPGSHTITLQGMASGTQVTDSIQIGIQDVAEIRIKNLELDSFAETASVSYRAAKTRLQVIGYREDGTEIGPVDVNWELEGGDVLVSQQLRMGILSHLGQPNTKIGNFDVGSPNGSIFTVVDASTVTFNSFLPGNITLTAKKGTASASVAIRIKQPTFKVAVHPVEGVDVSEIFDTWKSVTEHVWNREGILKVESIDLMHGISNVTYPNPPLNSPPIGGEIKMLSQLFENPSFLSPLVFDYLLGNNFGGFSYLPRSSGLLFETRVTPAVNVYATEQPLIFYADTSISPPKKKWRIPDIFAISIREFSIALENSGIFLRKPSLPILSQHQKYLAQGIGRIFGLPQNADWLTNLLDFGPDGGLEVTPLQYITALNYYGNNPQSSYFILEQ